MNFRNFLWSTFLIGVFSFGGGKAFIPIYQKFYVESYHFISTTTLQEYVGYALSFPGPISPMLTGLVGFFNWGWGGFFWGIFILTVPPIVILFLAYRLIRRYQDTRIFQFINLYLQASILALLSFVIIEFLWAQISPLWNHFSNYPRFFSLFFSGCLLGGILIQFSFYRWKHLKFLKYLVPFSIIGALIYAGVFLPSWRNFSIFSLLLFFSFLVIVKSRIHPIFLIILGAIIGILWIQP